MNILGTVLKITLFLLIIIVLANDVGVIALARWGAPEIAQAVADGAASSYKASVLSEEAAQTTARELAEQRGAVLTNFQIKNHTIAVWIDVPPKKTILAHRFESLEPYLSASASASATF